MTQAIEPPISSRNILDFIPSLRPYVDRVAWAENRMHTLQDEKQDAYRKRDLAQKELAEMTMSIQKEREQLQTQRDRNAASVQVKEEDVEKRKREYEQKLAILEKREQEFRTVALKSRRHFPTTGPDADLYDAIQSLGTTIEEAIRRMSNLVKSHKRSEQAFAIWEKRFCGPSFKIVKLSDRIQADRKKQELKTNEQTAAIQMREKTLDATELRLELNLTTLNDERRAFEVE